MLFTSQILTGASGSIGGLTASRNAGGPYFRARAVPINPNTTLQNDVRATIADLSNRWSNVLTKVERDAWTLYADNVPLTGPLGAERTVSGLAMYVRGNLSRGQAALIRADAAPVIFDTGDFSPVTDVIIVGQTVTFVFTNTDDWANEDEAAMLVYIGRPQNPGVNYFTGPYQFAGQIDGDGITPPTSPAVITSPFLITVGQKIFARVVVSRIDGRYSNDQKFDAVAA